MNWTRAILAAAVVFAIGLFAFNQPTFEAPVSTVTEWVADFFNTAGGNMSDEEARNTAVGLFAFLLATPAFLWGLTPSLR